MNLVKPIIGWTLFAWYYLFLVIYMLHAQDTQLIKLQNPDSTTCVPRQIAIDHMDKSRVGK